MKLHYTLVAKPVLALSKIFGSLTHFVITLIFFAYILDLIPRTLIPGSGIFYSIPYFTELSYTIGLYLIFLYRYALNDSKPKNRFTNALSTFAHAIGTFGAFPLLGYVVFFQNFTFNTIEVIIESLLVIFYLISTGFFSTGKDDIVIWLRRF